MSPFQFFNYNAESLFLLSPSMKKLVTFLLPMVLIVFSSVVANATPDEKKATQNLDQPDNSRSWQKLGEIKTNYENGSAYSSQVALDSAGNAIAVWEQFDKPIRDGGKSIGYWASRYTPQNGWDKAEKISADETEYPSYLDITMGASGNAVVTWVEDEIWSTTYKPNKGWGKPQKIKNSYASSGPHVVMSSSGKGIMAWDKYYKGIGVAHYDPESGWGDAVTIYNGSTLFAVPKVAINDSGNILLAWSGRTKKEPTSLSDIMAIYYTPKTGWSDAEKLKTQNVYTINPTIDSSGNGHLAWSNIKPDNINMWSSRYILGKGWSEEQKINSIASDQHTEVNISTDPSGNTFAIWSQKKDKCYCLWVNHFTEKEGWGTAQRIDIESGRGRIERLKIVVDASGNFIAIWQQDNSIFATHLSSQNKKGASHKLDQIKYGLGTPVSDISITPAGNAIAVWGQPHNKRYITKFRQFK